LGVSSCAPRSPPLPALLRSVVSVVVAAGPDLAPPQDKERWFRKYGHEIGGEKVGVLKMETPQEVTKVEDEKPKKGKQKEDSTF
jgi:hypothetical protein